jgi:hemoglobin
MDKDALYYRLGEKNIDLLVQYFYDLVFVNEQIAHLFKNDKEEIKGKQRLFLTQFLGGPQAYSEKFGHPQMRARHLPHPITQSDAMVWLHCMSQAIRELPIDETLKNELFARFPATAMFMVNKE